MMQEMKSEEMYAQNTEHEEIMESEIEHFDDIEKLQEFGINMSDISKLKRFVSILFFSIFFLFHFWSCITSITPQGSLTRLLLFMPPVYYAQEYSLQLQNYVSISSSFDPSSILLTRQSEDESNRIETMLEADVYPSFSL